MNLLYFTFCLVVAVFESQAASPTTYYISTSGKDSHTGTSPSTAWATINKVNTTLFLPGDSILFEGGSIFKGGIYLGAEELGKPSKVSGTPEKPIVVSSYGSGPATISSDKIAGFKAYNAAGIKVEKLIFTGAGATINESFGVEFYMDLPDTLLTFVCIDNIEVFGYREAGIAIASWGQTTGGFKDVSITNSSSHDNGDAGISVYAQGTAIRHENVYIGYNRAFNNLGIHEKWWTHSGNGIVVGSANGAVIEYCEAYSNGGNNHKSYGGPVGIWGYNCKNLLIQHNESYNNKTATHVDGGGFNIDGGCTNCTMQYNYSHNNDGSGFLLAQYHGAPPMIGITVRYNISENDARKNNFAGIHLWSSGASGGIQNVEIYNNSIFMSPANNSMPTAVYIQSPTIFNTKIANNIFQVTNGLRTLWLRAKADVKFIGNNYWPTKGSMNIGWESNTYNSLEAWRAATGQEMLNGSPTGYSIDPELKNPGKGVTIGDPTKLYTLSGYELKESSGLIGKGLNLKKEFGIDVGKYDFFGNSLEGLEEFSIGAHQVTPGSALPVTLTAFNVTKQGDAALLEWETASERRNRGFGVEVSVDKQTFRSLGFVVSKSPNSNQKQHYTYLDTELNKSGTRYYRLRQVDFDSTATYSDVRALVFDEEFINGIQVFPNPFNEAFTLEVTAEKADMLLVILSDPLGRVILETAQRIQPGKNTLQLPLSKQYPAGMYLLTASFNDKEHRIKLIRQ